MYTHTHTKERSDDRRGPFTAEQWLVDDVARSDRCADTHVLGGGKHPLGV